MRVSTGVLRDVAVVILFIVIGSLLHLDVFGEPNVRGFFKNDMSIYYPMANPETVNSVSLVLFAFCLPLVCMIIIWFSVDKVHRNDFTYNDTEQECSTELWTGVPLLESSRYDQSAVLLTNAVPVNSSSQSSSLPASPTRSAVSRLTGGLHWASNTTGTPRTRKLRFILYQFLVFCFLFAGVVLVTNSIKSLVGRLRPDFISRCDPDFTNPKLVYDADAPYISASYAFICQGISSVIVEGRKSFPSGHSSTAVFGAVFTAIYLSKRVTLRSSRVCGYFGLPVIQALILCGALLIAASRSWDNRHHGSDIIIGSLIGAAGAALALTFGIFTPSWELDGSIVNCTRNSIINDEDHSMTDEDSQISTRSQNNTGVDADATALHRAASIEVADIDV